MNKFSGFTDDELSYISGRLVWGYARNDRERAIRDRLSAHLQFECACREYRPTQPKE